MFRKLRRKAKEWSLAAYDVCFNRPVGYIYMFHMVSPKGDYLASMDELRVSPEYFEAFLREQQSRLEFISINDIHARMSSKQHNDKPFGIVTFDDGYADNFTYAYPILKKLNIPFVIYISAGFVNDHKPIWNYPLIIERIVRKNTELIIGGKRFDCRTEEQKNDMFYKLKTILFSLPYEKLQKEFKRLFAEYLTEDVFPQNTLSWEQIKELSQDSLCTIGCHTMTHCRLSITDVSALNYELSKSKNILEQQTGKPVKHLSYPYGWKKDVSPEAKAYAQQAGYQTALISYGGPLREKDNDMYQLKRIMVNEK